MEFTVSIDDSSAQPSDFFSGLLESYITELKLLTKISMEDMNSVNIKVTAKRIPINQENLKKMVEALQAETSFQVVFIEGSGTPYQLGKVIVIFLHRPASPTDSLTAEPIPYPELQFHLMHELGHQFGCLHAPAGIMSGRYCSQEQSSEPGPNTSNESPPKDSVLHLDPISIDILRTSRLFLTPSASTAPFQHRQLADGRVGIRTTQFLNLIVFGRNSEYLSYEKLAPGCTEITVDPGLATVLVVLTAEGNCYFINLK